MTHVTDERQAAAPVLEALRTVERDEIAGFGGPGHGEGRGATSDVIDLIGAQAFHADVLTPKGLDDRKQSAKVMQRACALAAEAWGAEACRFSTGGSTQSIQSVVATVAKPGDTILVAQNAHKAEFGAAFYSGVDIQIVPAGVDRERDIEQGMTKTALSAALERFPQTKAVFVVSPTIYGAVSDIAGLAALCHRHGIPLVVDAAWGAAFPFCSRLPQNPMALGADLMIVSVHKTMAALAQGSAMFTSGQRINRERFSLMCDQFQSTSPSVPILATMDATRRANVRDGEQIWTRVIDLADSAREQLGRIDGIVVRGREMIDGDSVVDLDATKLAFDVSGLGMTGSQADEWLQSQRRVSVVLSDNRHLVCSFGLAKSREYVDRLVSGVRDLARYAATRPPEFSAAPPTLPRYADLGFEMAMPSHEALYGDTEVVALKYAVGRIAAELIAPVPPEVPRLIPGQVISQTHVDFLLGMLAGGGIIADPAETGSDMVAVVRR